MKHQRISQEELSSCQFSTTSPVDQETMKKNANQALNSFRFMQEDFQQEDGHSSDLFQRKSGIPSVQIVHKVNGTESQFGESRHPVFRATSPLSRGQLRSKSGGKLSIHYCADLDTIKTVFRTIISVSQPQSLQSSHRNV